MINNKKLSQIRYERNDKTMKENAISKINKMGKVGHIISLIVKILLCIAIGGILIGTVAVAVLPEKLVTFSISGTADVLVNLEAFDVDLTDEEKSEISENIIGDGNNAALDLQGVSYGIDNVEVGDSTIGISASAKTFEYNLKDFLVVLIAALIMVVMTLVTVFFIDSLCKAFRDCSSPFDADVINKMQKFAFSLIPWAVISAGAESVLSSFFTATVSVSFGIDLGMVIVILVILALSYVFKYGAVLQQESDETL